MITGRRILVKVKPFTGSEYSVEIDPEEPRKDLYLSIVNVDPRELPENPLTPSRACPFINFFRSPHEFKEWQSTLDEKLRKAVKLVSLEEAYTLYKEKILKLLEEAVSR
jgi:hypothetical protein